MKIYTFLKKPNEAMLNDSTVPLDVKYALYAITPTKKDAKIFQKTRDMNQFIMRVIDVDEDEGYDEYLIRNRAHLLQYYWLESYKDKNTDNQTPYWIHVLITENELNFTMEVSDSGSILNRLNGFVPIDIFDEKPKNALYHLRYHKVIQSIVNTTMTEKFEYHSEENDFWDLGLSFDMFGIFLILYQHTFSTDFFSHTEVSFTQPEAPQPN